MGKVLADLDGDGMKELITYFQNSVEREKQTNASLVIDRWKHYPTMGPSFLFDRN